MLQFFELGFDPAMPESDCWIATKRRASYAPRCHTGVRNAHFPDGGRSAEAARIE